MATEPGLHAMVLTRQAEACVGSERCYDVHGRDIYVYEVRWYNVRADLKLPESWVHSIGFTNCKEEDARSSAAHRNLCTHLVL